MGTEDDSLYDILRKFKCSHDCDIENFLHNKAIEFEKLSKSKTYLLCDEESLKNGIFDILGYISISLKVLILPDTMSIRQRKDIDGYRGKIHGIPIREIPCYLIGQLAKNSAKDSNYITGNDLIKFSVAIIKQSVSLVGGRYVMIECHDNRKLLNFYESNGFKAIFNKPLDNKPMVQMIRAVV